eukprot:5224227-Karenia_brevis.AAC.1
MLILAEEDGASALSVDMLPHDKGEWTMRNGCNVYNICQLVETATRISLAPLENQDARPTSNYDDANAGLEAEVAQRQM